MSQSVSWPPFDCTEVPELASPSAYVAGVDEVGRGALFGPVVAAAALFPMTALPRLTLVVQKDSKRLSAKRRSELVQQIGAIALDWRVGYATAQEIDQINIFQASLQAMQRAVLKLTPPPQVCLVDGRFSLPEVPMPQKTLIKGDERSPVIAAASILAKVWRDELIIRLSAKYPAYNLAANKGYGTKEHRLALQRYGSSPQHRLSFRPCRLARQGENKD